ncbi:unnamed protein product [Dovyalis caffra]|uniref:SHSP domain-containing protein n=1 Tax=Dovyalis caffra TaxID=77055 RepID=A0AAV1RY29_9ROSI|nr:unnamed protein product [Dovyalis caffra]
MDATPSQAANPVSAEGTKSFVDATVIAKSDRLFLLYFIIGNYFGPDLKGEGSQKSLFQRAAEGLLIYKFDQLAGSCMGTAEMERIYNYVIRKAEKTLAVKVLPLQQFFLGNFLASGTDKYPQFTDMFPAHLHPHSVNENGDKIVSNIIFINNPDTFHIDLKDIERFKRLTGLENLLLDRDAVTFHPHADGSALFDVIVHEAGFGVEWPPINTIFSHNRAKPVDSILQSRDQHVQGSGLPPSDSSTSRHAKSKRPTEDGPALFFLPSCPKKEEWSKVMDATKYGLVLTGSAATGQVGQVVGLVDIGEGEDAYFFRVSLPGVRKTANEFNCKIKTDGKVLIEGVTITGERTVYKFSQKFEMLSKNLCPPGQFSVSFQLPGPVDPHQFSSSFVNGILEVLIMKSRRTAQ